MCLITGAAPHLIGVLGVMWYVSFCNRKSSEFWNHLPGDLGSGMGSLCDPGLHCSSTDHPHLPCITGLLVSLRYQPVNSKCQISSTAFHSLQTGGAISARPLLPNGPMLGMPSPVEAREAGPRPVATWFRGRLRSQARSLCKGLGAVSALAATRGVQALSDICIDGLVEE